MNKKTIKINFVRHAESKANTGEVCLGDNDFDVKLSYNGKLQSETLFKINPEILSKNWSKAFLGLYVSPYRRTVDTLKEYNLELKNQKVHAVEDNVIFEPLIMEAYFSNFGLQQYELKHTFQWLKTEASKTDYLFYNDKSLESMALVCTRATKFLEKLKLKAVAEDRLFTEATVLSHSIFFRALSAAVEANNKNQNPFEILFEKRNEPSINNCEVRFLEYYF